MVISERDYTLNVTRPLRRSSNPALCPGSGSRASTCCRRLNLDLKDSGVNDAALDPDHDGMCAILGT
jgi:hypothetical protein